MADRVARHLVAAGQIIDDDAELALQHAVAARRIASRVAVVREAVGLAAYAAGDWATAIAELRTYHRMTGRQTHLAEIADCERALGRPERAIDLYRGADRTALDKAGAIELLIVAAGARGDLGQHDAAVSMLQVRELDGDERAEWAPRLRYAFADALLAAGRRDEAREWFARAATADEDGLTDAAERLLELDGITIDDESDEDEAGEESAAADEGDLGEEDSSAGFADDDLDRDDDAAAQAEEAELADDDAATRFDDEDEAAATLDDEASATLGDEVTATLGDEVTATLGDEDSAALDHDDAAAAARDDEDDDTELGDETMAARLDDRDLDGDDDPAAGSGDAELADAAAAPPGARLDDGGLTALFSDAGGDTPARSEAAGDGTGGDDEKVAGDEFVVASEDDERRPQA
jgi:hypothetical protein